MWMTVVYVRIVRVHVRQRRMDMPMAVRFATVPRKPVGMAVVLVVGVGMRVVLQFVYVQMPMTFRQVQPDPCGHQERRCNELE